MATVVPSSGRARSMLGNDEGIGRQQTLHAIGDVPARERRSGDVLDVALERERRAVTLADELRAPQWFADLAAIGFAVLEDLDTADAAVGFQPDGVGDVVVAADHL